MMPIELRQELQHPLHVADGYHGQTPASQGIVGIVPLRPLGIHPHAASRHKIGSLGNHQLQKLGSQVHQCHPAFLVLHQLLVSPQGLCLFQELVAESLVKNQGISRVTADILIAFQPVWHIGSRKQLGRQAIIQQSSIIACQKLQQLLEINHLMVAPVAELCPRVRRVRTLPVNPLPGNAVRVKAVNGHGIDKLRHHIGNVLRVRYQQGFPVLENITPVALVVQHLVAVPISQGDVELIPRTGRVTMPAGENHRQVFHVQPGQLAVSRCKNLCLQGLLGNRLLPCRLRRFRHISQQPCRLIIFSCASLLDKGKKICHINPAIMGKEAAPHDIENHVGTMVDACHLVSRGLNAVSLTDKPVQLSIRSPDILCQKPCRLFPVSQHLFQLHHISCIQGMVKGTCPAVLGASCQLRLMQDKAAAPAAFNYICFRKLPASSKVLYHPIRNIHLILCGKPAGIGQQRLIWLRPVRQGRRQGKHGKSRLCIQLRALVGIHQHGHIVLQGGIHNGRHDIPGTIQNAHPLRLVSHIDDLCQLDQAKTPAGGPAIAENQLQSLITCLKNHLGAVDILVQIVLHAILRDACRPCSLQKPAKRLPKRYAISPFHLNRRIGAGGVLVVGNPVCRAVLENSVVGILPAGSDAALRPQKIPHIAGTGDSHEKIIHAVIVLQLVELFPVQNNKIALDTLGIAHNNSLPSLNSQIKITKQSTIKFSCFI